MLSNRNSVSPDRPLTARSVLLSLLLGNDPPRASVALLVRTAELFGIANGTARTALSRMVSAGELATADGWYELAAPELLARRDRQVASRSARTEPWDGRSWILVALTPSGPRSANDRAATRRALGAARLAELREGVWMRPANLAVALDHPPLDGEEVLGFRVEPDEDHAVVAARLWDLPGWSRRTHELLARMSDLLPHLDAHDHGALAPGFETSAAVLRHFQADPLLPAEVVPADWPGAALRTSYDRYDTAYRAVLSAWFRAHR